MRILPRGPSNSMKHSDKPTAWGGTSPKKVAGVAAARTLRGADANIRLSLAYSRRKTLAVWNTPCSRATSAAEAHNPAGIGKRSEEHTSELQSLRHLVCRLLLEKRRAHVSTPVTYASAKGPPAGKHTLMQR